LELNANPHRLDLDWRWGSLARSLGNKISINPDAHHVDGLDDVRYGIGIARKGWFTKSDVLNCLSTEEFMEFLDRRKS
jgi:DNA polymerase (family 10)